MGNLKFLSKFFYPQFIANSQKSHFCLKICKLIFFLLKTYNTKKIEPQIFRQKWDFQELEILEKNVDKNQRFLIL